MESDREGDGEGLSHILVVLQYFVYMTMYVFIDLRWILVN